MRYQDDVIKGKWLLLDGNEFVRVKFIDCDLVFAGNGPVSFDACNFLDCRWSFEGPALETLNYLAALYNGLGEAGQRLFNELVENLKAGPLADAAYQRSYGRARVPSIAAG